jgi:hypothetical protein
LVVKNTSSKTLGEPRARRIAARNDRAAREPQNLGVRAAFFGVFLMLAGVGGGCAVDVSKEIKDVPGGIQITEKTTTTYPNNDQVTEVTGTMFIPKIPEEHGKGDGNNGQQSSGQSSSN